MEILFSSYSSILVAIFNKQTDKKCLHQQIKKNNFSWPCFDKVILFKISNTAFINVLKH